MTTLIIVDSAEDDLNPLPPTTTFAPFSPAHNESSSNATAESSLGDLCQNFRVSSWEKNFSLPLLSFSVDRLSLYDIRPDCVQQYFGDSSVELREETPQPHELLPGQSRLCG